MKAALFFFSATGNTVKSLKLPGYQIKAHFNASQAAVTLNVSGWLGKQGLNGKESKNTGRQIKSPKLV